MRLPSWFSHRLRVPTRRRPLASRQPAFVRATLEHLEDRCLLDAAPATVVVTPTTPSLSYSSCLPGVATGVAVDSSGDSYIVGNTTNNQVFIDKLNPTGTALLSSTTLPGSGQGIALDSSTGDVYVTGFAGSNFPVVNGFSSAGGGFVTVLTPDLSTILYSTCIPGVVFNAFQTTVTDAIAVDSSGNAYVTGPANSNFITTASAYQTTSPSGGSTTSACLAKIDPNASGSASLVYATFLGGSGSDSGTGVAVDNSGNAYITGCTWSSDFPTTSGAFQKTSGGGEDVFVAKIDPTQSGSASLVYSTYLGGSGNDGYVSANPYYQIWSPQTGPGIAVDSNGDAYVTGSTGSSNFPTTPGAFQTSYQGGSGKGSLKVPNPADAFVSKLNATGTALVYSTYLGSNLSGASSIAVDDSGNAYVTGWTLSSNFPTVNPIQASKQPGVDSNNLPNSDVIVATLNSSGTGLLFSTYLGGPGGSFTYNKKTHTSTFTGSSGDDYGLGLAVDSLGNVYVTGLTYSSAFPTTSGAYQTTPGSGFVFMIDPPVSPTSTPATNTSSPRGVLPSSSTLQSAEKPASPLDQFFALLSDNFGATVSGLNGPTLPLNAASLDPTLVSALDVLLGEASSSDTPNALDNRLHHLLFAGPDTSTEV